MFGCIPGGNFESTLEDNSQEQVWEKYHEKFRGKLIKKIRKERLGFRENSLAEGLVNNWRKLGENYKWKS